MSKKLYLFSALLLIIALFSENVTGQKSYFAEGVQQKWITDQVLKTPESVYHDAENDIIYVSNIAGKPTAKDGKGFISKLTLSGEIEELVWVDGLNAPKGMGVFDGKLYVSDIDELAVIDIAQGKVVKRYKAENAQFLNDVAVSPYGHVYVSDMATAQIYILNNNKFLLWHASSMFERPNGLYYEDGHLLVGISGKILKINPQTKKVTVLVENTGGIDGLEADGKGHYVISDWLGNVHLVAPGMEKIKLLDTTPVKMNAADIYYIKEKDWLLVPTFNDNRVSAYKINR